MSEHSPLIIARFMDPEQQKALAQDVVREAGTSIEELPLELLATGQVHSPLITDEQYEQVLSHPNGQLKRLQGFESQEILEEQIRQHPTAAESLTTEVDKTVTRSRAGRTVIAYRFTSSEADDEYESLAHVIDDLNDTSTKWRPFYAKVILAVMARSDRRAGPLARAFRAVRPPQVLLKGARVMPAAELNRSLLEQVEA
jgi:hypothetical protein